MTRIKLCGMFRECDIDYANEALPDYVGFILFFPKSHRNISVETAEKLKKRLDQRIRSVGVFVNAPPERCAECFDRGIVDLIQLHGSEDEGYLRSLRAICKAPIIKAVKVGSTEDVRAAERFHADYLLFDSGTGSGKTFDHRLLGNASVGSPFFLAGGLTPQNLPETIRQYRPYAIDLSSGIETDGKKDREKMIEAVRAAREALP
ncbi:MAG: phosphoribosylanthranilate isomerase [Bacteroides sp.]|nr:phosphoribosylanthranilate isomerase [Eubacterium sp.]MCM1417265.1 phosphoribosylanthranilate isomerase [Roseburia sp.]MCM1461115.1 phosphoribosylanthranilate isomerase [Bacteroides sp.]